MAKGISIGIASDTKEFATGVQRGVITPLEDAADSLADVARAGDQAGSKLEQSFNAARMEVVDFKREQAELGRAISKSTGDASADLSRNFKKGTADGVDSIRELKSEGISNLSETLSSFDGTASGFIDGIQGTFGGIVQSLPGIGLAAGVAGAIGIGLIGKAFQDAQAEADALAARTSSAFDDMIASGKAYVSQDFVNQSIKATIEDADKYKQARQDARDLDLDISLILQAQAGDAGALYLVQQKIADTSADIVASKDSAANADGSATIRLSDQLTLLDNINGKYGTIGASNDSATAKAKLYLDTTNQTADGTAKIKSNLDNLPTSKTITITADTSDVDRAILRLAQTKVSIKVDGSTRNGVQLF